MDKEIRVFKTEELRVKKAPDGTVTTSGYAAVFDKLSEDLGGFTEKIDAGAFKHAIKKSDVRNLINHDPNLITGRTRAGTLRLKEDTVGLFKENDLPNTSYANDLAESISRGDITAQSFGFTVKRDTWEENRETGKVTRTINEVEELFDVSDVTFPAYPDTKVALRSLDNYRKKDAETRADEDKKEVEKKAEKDKETLKIQRAKRERELKLKAKEMA